MNNKHKITDQSWFKEFKRYTESMPNVKTTLPDKSQRTIEREKALRCQ
ncbi:hypothetical protein [Thalassotalea profundi]|uniref:Uncharacterized protein n=1 Tax=Thalassotalea profundi TaxID=2036687 RepID=A0ABQ3IMC8_9GAMM|nr:hypothetical protein [Thalassotalea profundi]GHE86256.1 hypothetical protein GCM10011501_14190 [Thalassotalea profundi]